MITMKLLAVLSDCAPSPLDSNGCFNLDYTAGMTVADALERTDIGKTNIKYTVFVNNARKDSSYALVDGDTVMVMPLLAGG